MSNTSATGGYLTALDPIAADSALQDAVQGFIVGITGMDGSMVRPAWQPDPPIVPTLETDWAAYGIERISADSTPYQNPPAADGSITVTQWRSATVRISFYGPSAQSNAGAFLLGAGIVQNTDAIAAAGILVKSVGATIVTRPEDTDGRWYMRCDVSITLRQEYTQRFGVLSFLTAGLELIANNDTTQTFIREIETTEPPGVS